MRKICWSVLLLLLLAPTYVSAALTTISFDDLDGEGTLPSNYQGLIWDSHWQYYGCSNPPYNASSGDVRIYTYNFGGWIDFGQDVTFMGSWVVTDIAGGETYWEGYKDGEKLYESAHLQAGQSSWIDVNWDVDYVKFVSTDQNHFIVDDVKYDSASAPVPEPATLLLLGAGLIGIAGYGRMKLS